MQPFWKDSGKEPAESSLPFRSFMACPCQEADGFTALALLKGSSPSRGVFRPEISSAYCNATFCHVQPLTICCARAPCTDVLHLPAAIGLQTTEWGPAKVLDIAWQSAVPAAQDLCM